MSRARKRGWERIGCWQRIVLPTWGRKWSSQWTCGFQVPGSFPCRIHVGSMSSLPAHEYLDDQWKYIYQVHLSYLYHIWLTNLAMCVAKAQETQDLLQAFHCNNEQSFTFTNRCCARKAAIQTYHHNYTTNLWAGSNHPQNSKKNNQPPSIQQLFLKPRQLLIPKNKISSLSFSYNCLRFRW